MMILISDLLVEPENVLRGLRLLRQRGHDVLCCTLWTTTSSIFRLRGPARFEGLESADHLTCNPRALREGYLAALR